MALHVSGPRKPGEQWPRASARTETPLVLSDDPADHGLSEAEVACIAKAYELRQREIRSAIEKPWKPSQRGEWLTWGPRPANAREWLLWIVLMPLTNVFLLLCKLFEPLEWASEWRATVRYRAELREELAQLEGPPFLQPVPEKTLAGMWRRYGLETDRFDESTAVELLSAWIDHLYGPEVTRAVEIAAPVERISRRRMELRQRSPQVSCVLYRPRLEQVLTELSRELPPYDWAVQGQSLRGSTLLH